MPTFTVVGVTPTPRASGGPAVVDVVEAPTGAVVLLVADPLFPLLEHATQTVAVTSSATIPNRCLRTATPFPEVHFIPSPAVSTAVIPPS
jgi:hypothetical protein